MPWDATPNAGFSTAAPWLPLNADWQERNATRLAAEPTSMLVLYKNLLALRRAHAALAFGDITLLEVDDAASDVLAYERRHGDDRLLIALNLGATPQELALPPWGHGARPLLSTRASGVSPSGVSPSRVSPSGVSPSGERSTGDRLVLRPNEGVILAPESAA
jgi:alpha-glucosidase